MLSQSIAEQRDPVSFIGREWERARLVQDLEQGIGLLTITGLSGIGKTRLARAAAGDVAPLFEAKGGIFFCSLESCESAADAERAIAKALGLGQLSPGELGLALAQRPRTLLILDSGEGLAAELAELLEPWLVRCPQLQIVLTSILPLELEGETRHELGPLSNADAIALYLDRVHAAGHTIKRSELQVIGKLVDRLGSIPLSIELAAARVRVLPPADLLSRMEQPLEPMLSDRSRGRRGSLAEVLEFTWKFLTPQEQSFLARASIFPGSFSLEAAIAVLGGGEEPFEVLELLDSLRGKGLLSLHDGEVARFSLLKGIRAFGSEKLEMTKERAIFAARHAQYFVRKGEHHISRINGPDYLDVLGSLRTERDNLIGALKNVGESDPELGARAGLILIRLALVDGGLYGMIPLLEQVLRAAQASGVPALAHRARMAMNLARSEESNPQERLTELASALEDARILGDLELQGRLLIAKSKVHEAAGDEAGAITCLQEAAELARLEQNPLLEGMARLSLSTAHINIWQVDEAAACLEEALTILRAHGFDRFVHLGVPTIQGMLRSLQGRYREGRAAMQKALAYSERIGDSVWRTTGHINLAWLESAAGRLDEALAHINTAITLFTSHDYQRAKGDAFFIKGIVELKRGDEKEAEAFLATAVNIWEANGNRLRLGRALCYLAVAQARTGHLGESMRSIEDARSYLPKRRRPLDSKMLYLLEGCADLARARSIEAEHPGEAERLARKARARLDLETTAAERTILVEPLWLLGADLKAWASRRSEHPAHLGTLLIAAGAAWFELPQGDRVDLRRRVAIRRLLELLTARRLEEPGVGTSPQELFAAGWPDAKVGKTTQLKRAYVGIWTLRSLGLADVLLNQPDGYLLDPSIPVERSSR